MKKYFRWLWYYRKSYNLFYWKMQYICFHALEQLILTISSKTLYKSTAYLVTLNLKKTKTEGFQYKENNIMYVFVCDPYLTPMGRRNACRASDAIRSGIRYTKWAGGSRSQTHRRAAKGGFTQDDGYVRGLAPKHILLLWILAARALAWQFQPL